MGCLVCEGAGLDTFAELFCAALRYVECVRVKAPDEPCRENRKGESREGRYGMVWYGVGTKSGGK